MHGEVVATAAVLPMVNLIASFKLVDELVICSFPLLMAMVYQNFCWFVFTVTVALLFITKTSLLFQVVGVYTTQLVD